SSLERGQTNACGREEFNLTLDPLQARANRIENAIAALDQWKFSPEQRNGVPVFFSILYSRSGEIEAAVRAFASSTAFISRHLLRAAHVSRTTYRSASWV